MARARNIKPQFFTDGALCKLSIPARFLFSALWCMADREGRLIDKPDDIEVFAFPRDNIDIEALLDELSQRFIIRYEVDGVRYIQVKNFGKHQSPHKNEQASTIPAPEMHQTCTMQAPDTQDADTVHAALDSLIPGFSDSPIPPKPPQGGDGGEDVLGVPVEALAEQQERLDYVERELRKNGFRANDGMMGKALALVEQVGNERFEEALSAANGAGTTHWNYVLKAAGAGPPGGPKNGDKDENGRVWLDGRWVLV